MKWFKVKFMWIKVVRDYIVSITVGYILYWVCFNFYCGALCSFVMCGCVCVCVCVCFVIVWVCVCVGIVIVWVFW